MFPWALEMLKLVSSGVVSRCWLILTAFCKICIMYEMLYYFWYLCQTGLNRVYCSEWQKLKYFIINPSIWRQCACHLKFKSWNWDYLLLELFFSSEIKSTHLVLSVLRYSRFLSNILTKLLSSVVNINGILIPVNLFPCSSCYYIFSSYYIFLVRSTGVYRIVRKIFGRWILKGQMKLRF